MPLWCGWSANVRPIFHKFAIIGNSNVALTLTAHQIVFDFRLTDKEIKRVWVWLHSHPPFSVRLLHIEMAERAFIGCVKRIFTDYHKWRVCVNACVWWTTTEEINIDKRFIIRFDKRVDSMSGNTEHTSRRIATAHPHTHPRSTQKIYSNHIQSSTVYSPWMHHHFNHCQFLLLQRYTLRISWRPSPNRTPLRRIHDWNSRAPKIKVNNFGRTFIYFLSGKWCFVNRNCVFFRKPNEYVEDVMEWSHCATTKTTRTEIPFFLLFEFVGNFACSFIHFSIMNFCQTLRCVGRGLVYLNSLFSFRAAHMSLSRLMNYKINNQMRLCVCVWVQMYGTIQRFRTRQNIKWTVFR